MTTLKMEKYRFLFILEEARLGGPQIYIINLLSALKSRCECTFIFPERGADRTTDMCVANGLVYKTLQLRTLSLKLSAILLYLITFLPDVIRTLKIIKSNDPEVVYIAGGSWQFKSAIAAFLSNRSFVWHLNDTQMHPLILFVFRIISKTTQNFVYASKRTEIYYKNHISSERNGVVIPSPVSNVFFEKVRNYKRQDVMTLKVVTVANINPIKGFDNLIEIAKLAKRNNTALEFYVVGEVFQTQSGYYEKIQCSIDTYELDNIHFIGASDQVEVILNDMDVYLCTSKSESSPISVWEAMATGLPIVSTDVGDVRHYVEGHNAGYIYSTAKQGHEGLQRLQQNSELLKDMGDAASHCAKQNFSANKCAELHLQFLKTISKDVR